MDVCYTRRFLILQIGLTSLAALFTVLTAIFSSLHLDINAVWGLRIAALSLNLLALLAPHYLVKLDYMKQPTVSKKMKVMSHVAILFPIGMATVNFMGLACEIQQARWEKDHWP